jgi:hypothetical protein
VDTNVMVDRGIRSPCNPQLIYLSYHQNISKSKYLYVEEYLLLQAGNSVRW